ncbi:hypothetical protein B0H14DRAFT_2564297 [Mycena olivaceomarginata]|nr:hypothetical protein B0H14DRAFT_2564297 [Mycena olivaceomarginata]
MSQSSLAKVKSVQVITCGLTGYLGLITSQSEGKLRIAKCLADAEVEDRVKCGLSAFKAPNDQGLLYGPKWPQQRIDQWLREVLPLLFEFLDRRYPEDAAPAYHWVLHKIPAALVRAGFNDALERLMAGEELASESGVESAPERAVRRKVPSEKDTSSSEDPESEDEEHDLQFTDEDEGNGRQRSKPAPVKIKREADADGESKVSVFLPFTALTCQPLPDVILITDDSDSEPFPAQLTGARLTGNRGSRKRAASPSFESVGSGKRTRSDSLCSHRSSTVSHGDSPSPRLRPATSSFQYDPAQDPAGADYLNRPGSTVSGSSSSALAPPAIPSRPPTASSSFFGYHTCQHTIDNAPKRVVHLALANLRFETISRVHREKGCMCLLLTIPGTESSLDATTASYDSKAFLSLLSLRAHRPVSLLTLVFSRSQLAAVEGSREHMAATSVPVPLTLDTPFPATAICSSALALGYCGLAMTILALVTGRKNVFRSGTDSDGVSRPRHVAPWRADWRQDATGRLHRPAL